MVSSGWSLTRGFFHRDGLIRVVSPEVFFLSGWSLTRGGLSSGWFLRVVFHQGGLSQEFSHQGDLSSGWSLIRVVSPGWSLTRVVFHQGGLSPRWSPMRGSALLYYHVQQVIHLVFYQLIYSKQRPYAANTQYAYNNWSPPAQSNETSNG